MEILEKWLILLLDRKAMYPTSLQFDFNNDRDDILELLKNVDVDDINPNPAYLVEAFLQIRLYYKIVYFLNYYYL